jgi:hypothetical protein
MILVDANILLYAYTPSDPSHELARNWLESELNGTRRVGLPWLSLLAFVRISANKRLAPAGPSLQGAWLQVEQWLSSPRVWIPEPTNTHPAILCKLLALPGLRLNDVNDAHLAALAIEHGLTLCSADVGFARFPGLRWENPIAD